MATELQVGDNVIVTHVLATRVFGVATVEKVTEKSVFVGKVDAFSDGGIYARRFSSEDVVPWTAELEARLRALGVERAALNDAAYAKAREAVETFKLAR